MCEISSTRSEVLIKVSPKPQADVLEEVGAAEELVELSKTLTPPVLIPVPANTEAVSLE